MAKKDGKKDKAGKSRADQVRSAVDQAFEATAGSAQPVRERAVQVADELSQSLQRFRELVDDARPVSANEITDLRDELAALSTRVEALEKAPKPRATATGRKPAAARASAASTRAKPAGGTAAKAAAARTAAGARTSPKRPAAPRKPPAAS